MTMLSHYGALGGAPAVYVEDVFSTYLYTGNGSTQTITNGIDLSGKGGLVWQKSRQDIGWWHILFDTVTGINKNLSTNVSNAQTTVSGNSVLSNGFVTGTNGGYTNENNYSFASWTFRKQPKFFDIVTWTGDGTSNRLISHNLNSVPGCVIVKCTSTARSWVVAARANDSTYRYLILNGTDSQVGSNSISTYATSTTFNLTAFTNGGRPLDDVNGNGNTYVAYLFAHDAGGFGASGNDNVISCGSFTTPGGQGDFSGYTVTLGYEPQFVLMKRTDNTGDWFIFDNMRGTPVDYSGATQASPVLFPNLSNAESQYSPSCVVPTPTGFAINNSFFTFNASTYIYIAIRRPMKTPTTGTSVFAPQATRGATNGTSSSNAWTSNFPIDWFIMGYKVGGSDTPNVSRLTNSYLYTTNTNAESSQSFYKFDDMDGVYGSSTISANSNYCAWMFRRAPGFFDVVCYTGTGVARTVNHNLGVVPELMIVKRRNLGREWGVYVSALGNTKGLILDKVDAAGVDTMLWNSTSPTSSVFTVGTSSTTNASSDTYVAYLFASCPGVSKVGSYTGNGSSQTINCGFTAGARFVMIKRTDSTGDWYVWDTARGIVASNDPHLSLNTTAAEVTTDDSVDTDNSGFIVNQVSATNINVSSATYIYLAIA